MYQAVLKARCIYSGFFSIVIMEAAVKTTGCLNKDS
jgi:hypothetical protein